MKHVFTSDEHEWCKRGLCIMSLQYKNKIVQWKYFIICVGTELILTFKITSPHIALVQFYLTKSNM